MMTRIVMMKMMRSTNITSTRGVTLMSAIASASSVTPVFIAMAVTSAGRYGRGLHGGGRPSVHTEAHFHAGDQIRVQLVREVADALLHLLVAAKKNVVSQHSRHRDEQTDGSHDQRLTDGSCHLVDGGLSRDADRDQRVVDTDDGAEHADER